MRTVRSLRVLLALGVGLMAITAGLANDLETTGGELNDIDSAPTAEDEPIDLGAAAPTAEDATIVTVTTTDPNADSTTDPEKDPLTLDDGLNAASAVLEADTLLDGATAATDALNGEDGTPILDAAAETTKIISDAAQNVNTQEVPSLNDASATDVTGTVAETTANLAGQVVDSSSSGQVGTGAIANQYVNSDLAGVRANGLAVCLHYVPFDRPTNHVVGSSTQTTRTHKSLHAPPAPHQPNPTYRWRRSRRWPRPS
jgi:hypothetical protein